MEEGIVNANMHASEKKKKIQHATCKAQRRPKNQL